MRVGLIGIGLVGSALAKLLLGAGIEVLGHDLVAEKVDAFVVSGGVAGESVASIARECKVIILSLYDDAAVEDVLLGERGVASRASPGTLVIDTTTGHPDKAIEFHGALSAKAITYVDAPVAGTSGQIGDKDGVFMAGCGSDLDPRIGAILNVVARELSFFGAPGAGRRAKIAVNLVLGLNRAVLAEGIAFAETLGIDAPSAVRLFSITPAASKAIELKGERMVSGNFTNPHARLKQHAKDVSIMKALAREMGVSLPFTTTHQHVLEEAIEAGDGDLDNSAIVKQLRRYMVR